MSRASRRAAKGRGGRRRARRGRGIPWLLVAAVGGVAVVAIIAVVAIQGGGSTNPSATEAEADADLTLPGDYVNLPEIYGGAYSATAGHVSIDVDYVADGNSDPPTGGPHWSGDCGSDPSEAPAFCGPAPWGIYREPWEPETLVHNMEHGGLVVWYNTTNQDVIEEIEELVEDRLGDGDILVMAPYPEMDEEQIAITSWSRIDSFAVSEYTKERVERFIDVHERRFNPEDF